MQRNESKPLSDLIFDDDKPSRIEQLRAWLTHWPNLSLWWTKVRLKVPLIVYAIRGR